MTAAIPLEIRPRLAQLVRLLASPHDGEIVASARAIRRTLDANGLDLDDLAGAVEREAAERVVFRDRPKATDVPEWARPMQSARSRPKQGDVVPDFAQRRSAVEALRRGLAAGRLSDWEHEFATSILGRLQDGNGRLTMKQGDALGRLLARLGEGSTWVWA